MGGRQKNCHDVARKEQSTPLSAKERVQHLSPLASLPTTLSTMQQTQLHTVANGEYWYKANQGWLPRHARPACGRFASLQTCTTCDKHAGTCDKQQTGTETTSLSHQASPCNLTRPACAAHAHSTCAHFQQANSQNVGGGNHSTNNFMQPPGITMHSLPRAAHAAHAHTTHAHVCTPIQKTTFATLR